MRVWVHVEGDSRWVVDVDVDVEGDVEGDSRWMVEMFGVWDKYFRIETFFGVWRCLKKP